MRNSARQAALLCLSVAMICCSASAVIAAPLARVAEPDLGRAPTDSAEVKAIQNWLVASEMKALAEGNKLVLKAPDSPPAPKDGPVAKYIVTSSVTIIGGGASGFPLSFKKNEDASKPKPKKYTVSVDMRLTETISKQIVAVASKSFSQEGEWSAWPSPKELSEGNEFGKQLTSAMELACKDLLQRVPAQ